MSQYIQPPTSRINPEPFKQQPNNYGTNQYTSGARGNPNDSGATDQQNQLVNYYGVPQQGFPQDPYANYPQDLSHLIDAYVGKPNPQLREIVLTHIDRAAQWPINIALPLEHSEDMTFNWMQRRYNDHNLDRNPEESIPRMLTKTTRKFEASMNRHGITFEMTNDFFKTPEGRSDYACHLVQIANAALNTMELGAVVAIYYTPSVDDPYEVYRMSQIDSMAEITAKFSGELAQWACVQKRPQSLSLQIEQAKSRLIQSSGSAGDLTVLVQGMAAYINNDPSQQIYALTGHKSDEKRDLVPGMVGGGTIVYSRDYHQEASEPMIDPAIHDRSIGNSFLMNDIGLIGCEPKNFETSKMDRLIYDESADNVVNFGFAQNFYAAGLFHYPQTDYDENDAWFSRGTGLPSLGNDGSGGPYQGPTGNDLDFAGRGGRGILSSTGYRSTLFDNNKFPFMTDSIGVKFFEGCHTWGAYFSRFERKQNVTEYHIKCFLERDLDVHQDFIYMAGETVRQFRSLNANINNTNSWEQALSILDYVQPANAVRPAAVAELDACKSLESIAVKCQGLNKDNYRLMRTSLKQGEQLIQSYLTAAVPAQDVTAANDALIAAIDANRKNPITDAAISTIWTAVENLIMVAQTKKFQAIAVANNAPLSAYKAGDTSILSLASLRFGNENAQFRVDNIIAGIIARDNHLISHFATYADFSALFAGAEREFGVVNLGAADISKMQTAFASRQISAMIAIAKFNATGQMAIDVDPNNAIQRLKLSTGINAAATLGGLVGAGGADIARALNMPVKLFNSQMWASPLVNQAVRTLKNFQKTCDLPGPTGPQACMDEFQKDLQELKSMMTKTMGFTVDYSSVATGGNSTRTRYSRLQSLSQQDHIRMSQAANSIIEAKITDYKGKADNNISNLLDRVFSMYSAFLVDIYKLLDVVADAEEDIQDADGNVLSNEQLAGSYLDKILDVIFVNFIRKHGGSAYRFVSIYLRVIIEDLQTKDLNEIVESDAFGDARLKLGKWWKNQVVEDDKQVARLLDLAREFVQDPNAQAPAQATAAMESRRLLVAPNEIITMSIRQLQRMSQERFQVYDVVFHEIMAHFWKESSFNPDLNTEELIAAMIPQFVDWQLSGTVDEARLALYAIAYGLNDNGQEVENMIRAADANITDQQIVVVSNYVVALGFEGLPAALNLQAGNNGPVANRNPVKKLRNKLTRSQYIAILHQLPIAGNFPTFCFENDILLPIFLLCMRPHMRYAMGTCIHMHGRGKSGKTYWSHASMMINRDAGRMTHLFHYAQWFRAVVMETANIVRMNNVICKQYLGGHGSAVYNPLDSEHLDGYRSGLNDADIFVVPEKPYKELNPTVLDITGQYSERLKVTPRQNSLTNYTMATTMQQIWNWTPERRIEQLSSKYTPDVSQNGCNTLVWQAYNHYWNESTKSFSNVIQEAGHWRDCIYRGSGAVRNCHEPYFKQSTLHAQAVISV